MLKTSFITSLICSGLLFSNALYAQQCEAGKSSLTPNSRYQILNKGTEVKDTRTGLIWQRCVTGEKWNGNTCVGSQIDFSHEEALKFIQLKAKGWRLPTINELLTLSSVNCWEPAINTNIFPFNPERYEKSDILRSSSRYHLSKAENLDVQRRYGNYDFYWAFSTTYGDKRYLGYDLPMRLVRK